MPIIKSAKKALRQSVKKQARNDHFRNLYREVRVAFERNLKAGNAADARKVYFGEKDASGKTIKVGLQATIDKLVKKNIIEMNNGSRKKSLFAKKLKNLENSSKS